jgi:hypothetical protein
MMRASINFQLKRKCRHEDIEAQQMEPEAHPAPAPEIVIPQDVKVYLREQCRVRICMEPGCNQKCMKLTCKLHTARRCAHPGCAQNTYRVLCGYHSDRAIEARRVYHRRYADRRRRQLAEQDAPDDPPPALDVPVDHE